MRITTFRKLVTCAIALLLLVSKSYSIQVNPGDTNHKKADSIKLGKQDKMPGNKTAVITAIYVYPDSLARYDDRLEVHVRNLDTLIKSNTTSDSLVLFLDNYKLIDIKGAPIDDSVVNFTMYAYDAAFWTAEYKKSVNGVVVPKVAIGTPDGKHISKTFNNDKAKPKFEIRIYQPYMMWIMWILFFGLIFGAFWAGTKTDLLRENCTCNCTDNTKKKNKPFSLSRSQMAFWTLIVAFSFAYIYLITGEMPNITNGTLILLGISSSTALVGYVVDNADPSKKNGNVPADMCCSDGFITDVLSDGGILGIHRVQNVIFTLILGTIYLTEAVNRLVMTEFNTNLLILMGISSGTYVGMKYYANKASAQNAQAQPNPDNPNPPVQPQQNQANP